MRFPTHLIGSRAVRLQATAAVLFAAAAAAAAAAAPAERGAELPAHQACARAIRSALSYRQPLLEAAEKRDIEGYKRGLRELTPILVEARDQYEAAAVSGAWKEAALRREAFALRPRVDAILTLRLMAESPIRGYVQWAGKVPASTLDGAGRLFGQLDQLSLQVAALNAKAAGAPPAGARPAAVDAPAATKVAAVAVQPASAGGEAPPASVGEEAGPHFALKVSGGAFHGPGQLPDSPLPTGLLGHIRFNRFLTGETSFFNNGEAPPNAPEPGLNGKNDGRLSDGTPFNEHVWGGIAEVGRGAMKFMVVVTSNGPNRGTEKYTLQDDLNWRINTDLALDPGFPEGIVVSKDIRISSGVVWVPRSVQSQTGIEGGQDRAGSLPSGIPVVGRLGDYDGDGFLDGSIVGGSNVPITNLLAPGAPVVQRRDFVSDIPVKPLDAATLTLGSIANFAAVWAAADAADKTAEAKAWMRGHRADQLADVADRWAAAGRLLAKVSSDERPVREARAAVEAQAKAAAALLAWAKANRDAAPPAEIQGQAEQMWNTAKDLSTRLVPLTLIAAR
jgi:hypothetical protein